jgi:hypothetical protein
MGFGIAAHPRSQESESTASRPICAVNQSAAQLVPRWGTTWESWVLWFLFFIFGRIFGWIQGRSIELDLCVSCL